LWSSQNIPERLGSVFFFQRPVPQASGDIYPYSAF